MEQLQYKPIEGTPFRLEISTVQNKPGTWNSTKVSIYRDNEFDVKADVYSEGTLIGEYLRNYSSFGFETFYPFEINNEWYALYSANYTATRVMKLHEDRIEDWCGEDPHSAGFCPTEYYVPKYAHVREDNEYDVFYIDGDYEYEEFSTILKNPYFVDLKYCDFGFMSGCVWGDDISWKLRYIDLSRIPEKELVITEKFGYWELPAEPLKKCVRMDGWEPEHDWVSIKKQEYFNLKNNAGG